MRRMYSKPQLLEAVESESKINGIKVFEDIKDKDGHNRFIEGDIELGSGVPSGITKDYGKWSLSGTHLTIVLVLDIEDTTVLNQFVVIAKMTLPQWIGEKIVGLFGSTYNVVIQQNFSAYDISGSIQNVATRLQKTSDTELIINHIGSAATFTADRKLRLNYDLLID